jgi:hypothetical protein
MKAVEREKGFMAKKSKSKLGTPHTETTPESRAATNMKNVNTRYHLAHGASEDAMNTELSETTGQSPEERFKSRGVTAVTLPSKPTKRLPSKSWF